MSPASPVRAVLCAAALLSGCARPRAVVWVSPQVTPQPASLCETCTAGSSSNDLLNVLSLRVVDLKLRGGACMAYGRVLEASLTAGRVVVRPFMWHVGARLAAARGISTGEIDVAREIDSLNVGVRRLDEVVHSVEHEAAHIAFAIPSGNEQNEVLVDERVGQCRANTASSGAH